MGIVYFVGLAYQFTRFVPVILGTFECNLCTTRVISIVLPYKVNQLTVIAVQSLVNVVPRFIIVVNVLLTVEESIITLLFDDIELLYKFIG